MIVKIITIDSIEQNAFKLPILDKTEVVYKPEKGQDLIHFKFVIFVTKYLFEFIQQI